MSAFGITSEVDPFAAYGGNADEAATCERGTVYVPGETSMLDGAPIARQRE